MTPRRLRWLAPLTIVAGVGAAAAVPSFLPAGAEPVPVLAELTPAQLLEKVQSANVTTLSGDITLTANLGLPDLSMFGSPQTSGALSLLSGSHTAHVAIADPEHARLAIDGPRSESDWIRNGPDLWAWNSTNQTVQHTTLASSGGSGGAATGSIEAGKQDDPHDDQQGQQADGRPAMDPQAVADRLLAAVDPSTEVSVRTPGYVAGRPVYELVLSPRSAVSTIGAAVISVDATTGLPLAVRVEAKGATSPVLQVTFTSISYDKPADKTFAFTPPPGATVTEVAKPADLLPLGASTEHRRHRDGNAAPDGSTPTTTPSSAATSELPQLASGGLSAQTVGQDWDTVEVISGLDAKGPYQLLLQAAPAVTMSDGSTAHLVSTRLLNALILADGRIVVGAVTPEALQAAVQGR